MNSERLPKLGIYMKAAIAATGIAVLLTVFLLVAALVVSVARIYAGVSASLEAPLPIKVFGAAVAALGLVFLFWTVRSRRPRDIVESTWITMRKLLTGGSLQDQAGRTEPFLPKGPYRYVRNPIYFGGTAAVFGAALLQGSLTILVWSILVFAWFWGFLIPFEERELEALFGSQYAHYARQVPKMIPYGRRFRGET